MTTRHIPARDEVTCNRCGKVADGVEFANGIYVEVWVNVLRDSGGGVDLCEECGEAFNKWLVEPM